MDSTRRLAWQSTRSATPWWPGHARWPASESHRSVATTRSPPPGPRPPVSANPVSPIGSRGGRRPGRQRARAVVGVASPGIRLLAARYEAATGTWTTTANLSTIQRSAFNVDVAFDAAGRATAVWFEGEQGFGVIQSRSWLSTLPAPSVTGVTPTSGHLAITVAPKQPSKPRLRRPRSSIHSMAAPPGRRARPRAWARPWRSRASPTASSTTSSAGREQRRRRPRVHRTARAFRNRDRADRPAHRLAHRQPRHLPWVAPSAGIVPTAYLIEGGISGQPQVLASLPTGGAATQIVLDVPNGAFDVRVVAVHGTSRLGQSSTLQIRVNAGAVPSAATSLLGSANGSLLALSWTNTWSGAALTGIRLDVSGSITTAINLPPTEQFTFGSVPPGSYTFAVSPLVGAVLGDASNAVTLTFPGACGAPRTRRRRSASAHKAVGCSWIGCRRPPAPPPSAMSCRCPAPSAAVSRPSRERWPCRCRPAGTGQRRLDGSLRHQRADRRANGDRAVTR